ncbi:MAG: hypothetical protein WC878_08485 [Candidatus Paceibacterota bacterium]|jgi:hypothetical protein
MSYEATEKEQIELAYVKKPWLRAAIEKVPYTAEEEISIKFRTGFKTFEKLRSTRWYECNNEHISITRWLQQRVSEQRDGQYLRKIFLDKDGNIVHDTLFWDKNKSVLSFWKSRKTFDRRSTLEILRYLANEKRAPFYMLFIYAGDIYCHSRECFLYQTPKQQGFISLSEYAEHILWEESKNESKKLEKALNGDAENAPELESLKKSLQKLAERIDIGDASLYQAREELRKLCEPPIVKKTKGEPIYDSFAEHRINN